MSEEFVTDVTTLRNRARQHIERGAVTKGYKGQLDVVLRLLNALNPRSGSTRC